MDRVWIGSGHFEGGSFPFIAQLEFRSAMDRFILCVRVQIGSFHFRCQFKYEFGLFSTNFRFRISAARSR